MLQIHAIANSFVLLLLIESSSSDPLPIRLLI